MTFEERIKELALEKGCGVFLAGDAELSLKEQYGLIRAAERRNEHSLPDDINIWDKFENETPAELLELIDIETDCREHEYKQVAKWARMPNRLCTTKESLETLEHYKMKLLSTEALKEILAGEPMDCDTLLQSLLHAGYDAGYHNIVANSAGFCALFYVDGEIIGVVDSFSMEHTVRAWKSEML